jgi:hypothetical protein
MTITYNLTTPISPETWANLANEYLAPEARNSPVAQDNGEKLCAYVAKRISVRVGHSFVHNGGDFTLGYPNGPRWVPVANDTPYSDFDQMLNAWTAGEVMQVSDLHHDHPVFGRLDNLRFRVWHDTEHVVSRVGFSTGEEVAVFIMSARQILNETNNQAVVDALFCESIYQLAAFETLGSYPDEQYVRTPGPAARALLDAWGLRAR